MGPRLRLRVRRVKGKGMPHISITRLRLRSLRFLPAFLREVETIVAQVKKSAGYQGGGLLLEGRMVFWTRSAWDSLEAMKAFRDSDAHRVSMPKLLEWCDEASVAQWQGEMSKDWDEIRERMIGEGRMSKVRNPSPAQKEKRIGKLHRWVPERSVMPEKTT